MILPTYDELCSALEPVALDQRVSEWHGYLCGALAVDIRFPLPTSVDTLVANAAPIQVTPESTRLMNTVYEVVQSQMTDSNLQFELCLPDSDKTNLTQRVIALAAWCDGFLYGVANAGLQDVSALSKESREILQDFSRIAQLDGADTGEEDEEVSYNELMEYVRMATLLIAEEIQPLKSSEGLH